MSAGKLITLEGGEGVGKSTLAHAIVAHLRNEGRAVIATREPGGAPGADEIRALLVRGDELRWSRESEALLFAAARADHVHATIAPALARGEWVVCDRFTDSTRAYQGAGRGLASEKLDALDAFIAAPVPDLTLILDLDPSIGLARSGGAGRGEDRYERMDSAFHARVRAAFLDIATRAPQRCAVLDANQTKDAVLGAALDAIASRLGGAS